MATRSRTLVRATKGGTVTEDGSDWPDEEEQFWASVDFHIDLMKEWEDE